MSTTFPHLILFFLIFIVNVHLIFNFFREPDVHALQIALFFQQLHKILQQSSKHTSPWIVCGDFNMHPDFPVYEMLRHGKLFIDSVEKLNPAKWKYPEFVKQNEVGLLIWYMIFGRLLAKRASWPVVDPARFLEGARHAAKHTEPSAGYHYQRTVMKAYPVVSQLQFTDMLNKYNFIKYKSQILLIL